MKKINELLTYYHQKILEINDSKLSKEHELKSKINESKKCLQDLRSYFYTSKKLTLNEEINFFKNIKPQLCGEMRSYRLQLEYYLEKTILTSSQTEELIKKSLGKLERFKNKHKLFFIYYLHGQNHYDHHYFTINNQQLSFDLSIENEYNDLLFSTSHDFLASKIVTYQNMVKFYKNELELLANQEKGFYNFNATNINLANFQWTASKTDLIELIYALKTSGAINGGDTQIKQLTQLFSNVFNIDLGNYYKTYNEIRNRSDNQTKFLNKLSKNLTHKFVLDEV